MNDFSSGYKTYDPKRNGYGNPGQWRRAFYKKMSSDEARAILDEDDPYAVLGIAKNATLKQIKMAFHAQALIWHPDRNPGNVEKATKMMQKINAAYDLLT